MPIKKLLSAFAPGEDDNWKSMKVTYTPEEREATVAEAESILSRYDDISDIQKHKIINKFSQVMWWENMYVIDLRHWSEIADAINPSILSYVKGDMRREIFHDLENKFINYDNAQELYGYIDDVLLWKDITITQPTLSHIQDYINTLDGDTKQRVSEHVEYTTDSINFKVKINWQNMLVPFNYHDATKTKDIIKDWNEQVVTKEVNVNGKDIKETYFRWDWLNNTYDLQDTVKKDSLYIDTLDDDLRYVLTDTLYEQLLQVMPAWDYNNRGNWYKAWKQLSWLLGVQFTGYRYDG